jgi:hypothetical protein
MAYLWETIFPGGWRRNFAEAYLAPGFRKTVMRL